MAKSVSEQQKSNLTPDVVLEHDAAIRLAQRNVREAQSALAHAWKKATSAGIDKKAMKLKMALVAMDADERDMLLRNTVRMAKWCGTPIGTQGNLFDAGDDQQPTDKTSAIYRRQQIEDEGYYAGAEGRLVGDNPYPAGSENYQSWDEGCRKGLDARSRSGKDEKNEKTASTRRGRKPREEQEQTAPQPGVQATQKRRGRPPRLTAEEAKSMEVAPEENEDSGDEAVITFPLSGGRH